MSEKEIDWTKADQLVRREASKRFGRELGRWGVNNIAVFTLDMVRKIDEARKNSLPAEATRTDGQEKLGI